VTSLLLARRVIVRIGSAAAAGLGAVLFGVGMAWFPVVLGLEPNMTAAIASIMVLGIAVGLAFPTLMDAGTAALPASAYATGPGVLNMVRQTALALGVAIAIAVLGTPPTAVDQLAAFRNVWLVFGWLRARQRPTRLPIDSADAAACRRWQPE
jgi:hypothetical protein